MRFKLLYLSVALLATLTLIACGFPGEPMLDDMYTKDVFPGLDSTYDVGAAGNEYAEGHFDALWIAGAPAGGGVTDFTDLGDVDNDYTGDGGKYLRVLATEDGIEFINLAGGGNVTTSGAANVGRMAYFTAGTNIEETVAFWDNANNRMGINDDTPSVELDIDGDFAITGSATIGGFVDWAAGNITFVPLTGDIQTYVTNATAGDTLVLASGEYVITATITISKQLNIVGQGNAGFITAPVTPSHGTIISCATNNVTTFQISNDNVRIANMSINMTGDNSMAINTATNLVGVVFNNIDVVIDCAGTAQAFTIDSTDAVLRDLTFYVTSSDNTASGVLAYNNGTSTQDAVVDCFNVTGTVVGGATSAYAFGCWNNNDGGHTITLNLSDTIGVSLAGTPLDVAVVSYSVTTNNAIVNAYLCTFDGADYDAYQTGTNQLNVGGSVLVNGLTFGTITYRATMTSQDIVASNDVTIGGDIIITGVVDGRDIATDGTKLDGIEITATADQTGAEIKALYEAEADTNAYTDAEKNKLAGVELLADVTDTANVDTAGATMNTDFNAKGDLLTATGDDAPVILSSSAVDGNVLTVDTAQASGLKWATPAGGGATITVSGDVVYNDASPVVWTDLDLSGTIGASSTLVFLAFNSTSDLNAVSVRMDGDTLNYFDIADEQNAYGCALGHHDDNTPLVLLTLTDPNGVIEWITESSETATVTLLYYIQ